MEILRTATSVMDTVCSSHEFISSGSFSDDSEDGSSQVTVAMEALSRRLEEALRAAKSEHLSCGEVLLPADLLPAIARDVLQMAQSEPCGLRGCTLYVNFEGEQVSKQSIGKIRCDSNTITTFEVYLTLKQDYSPWYSILPQFLRNLTKSGTVILSSSYTLKKRKLYRSSQ